MVTTSLISVPHLEQRRAVSRFVALSPLPGAPLAVKLLSVFDWRCIGADCVSIQGRHCLCRCGAERSGLLLLALSAHEINAANPSRFHMTDGPLGRTGAVRSFEGTGARRWRCRRGSIMELQDARTVYAFGLAAALAGSALLSTGANAAEVCDKNCVGPACKTDCVREPDATLVVTAMSPSSGVVSRVSR